MGDVKSFRLSKNYNDNNDLNWFFSDLIFWLIIGLLCWLQKEE